MCFTNVSYNDMSFDFVQREDEASQLEPVTWQTIRASRSHVAAEGITNG
jgi:hypothetical protein